jgi:hypothetical protein
LSRAVSACRSSGEPRTMSVRRPPPPAPSPLHGAWAERDAGRALARASPESETP